MSVLTFLDACSCQAEDVHLERIQVDLGSDGLGLCLFMFIALHLPNFVTRYGALDPGFCGFFFFSFIFRMFSNLMQCLFTLALQVVHHCPAHIFVRGNEQLVLVEKEGF